jgi:hypothetical protein
LNRTVVLYGTTLPYPLSKSIFVEPNLPGAEPNDWNNA